MNIKLRKSGGLAAGAEGVGAAEQGPRSLRGETRKQGARNTILLLIEEKSPQIEPVKHR